MSLSLTDEHREIMIELLLSRVFDGRYAPGEYMSLQTKVDLALGRKTIKLPDIEGLPKPPARPTADFYLAACPIPPLTRNPKTLRERLDNIPVLLRAYSQLCYWQGTERLKITAAEVGESHAFARLKNRFTVQGINLSVAGVNDHHTGRGGIRTCVSLKADYL